MGWSLPEFILDADPGHILDNASNARLIAAAPDLLAGYIALADENERLRLEVADLRDFCKGVARNITDMLKEPKP
jgi:hypothetical protein